MRFLGVGGLCAVAACSGDGSNDRTTDRSDSSTSPPADCTADPVTLEAGSGEYAFEPLTDADPVVLVHGPQGGWHVWISGEVANAGPTISVAATLWSVARKSWLAGSDDAPVTVDLSDPAVGTWDPETCTGTFFGQFAYVNDASPPPGSTYLDLICSLEDDVMELVVTVSRLDAATTDPTATASDTVQVIGALDTEDVPSCH